MLARDPCVTVKGRHSLIKSESAECPGSIFYFLLHYDIRLERGTNKPPGHVLTETLFPLPRSHMSLFFRRQNAEKQYIHLIKEASEKWPNWDPAKKLDVSVGSLGSFYVRAFGLTASLHNRPVILEHLTRRRASLRLRETSIPTPRLKTLSRSSEKFEEP
jgi:hypothetical protein